MNPAKIKSLKNLVNKFTLILTLSFLIIDCSSPNEETTEIDKKEELNFPIENGPIASGCPNTDYPDWETSPYVLPYPVGESYKIDLSNCSGSYHSDGRPDQFAIDFDMDIRTVITATRPGEVVHIVESGFDGGHPNNLVVVDHGDETYAEYMHLTNNGAFVEVGDLVCQGDTIGLSGSTGLAGYPHLHFVVAIGGWKWPYQSAPVTFSNTIANVNSLASKSFYEAFEY